jgi:hypothetical protein
MCQFSLFSSYLLPFHHDWVSFQPWFVLPVRVFPTIYRIVLACRLIMIKVSLNEIKNKTALVTFFIQLLPLVVLADFSP